MHCSPFSEALEGFTRGDKVGLCHDILLLIEKGMPYMLVWWVSCCVGCSFAGERRTIARTELLDPLLLTHTIRSTAHRPVGTVGQTCLGLAEQSQGFGLVTVSVSPARHSGMVLGDGILWQPFERLRLSRGQEKLPENSFTLLECKTYTASVTKLRRIAPGCSYLNRLTYI